jgi:energy-coupling factor transporter ATP-binding protein EcfA2
MDSVLAGLHQGNPDRHAVTFLYHRQGGAISLGCVVPEELRGVLQGQFYAQYPDCTLEPTPATALNQPQDAHCWSCELQLRHDLFPHKRYGQFEDALNRTIADPLTAVLITLGSNRTPLQCRIEIVIRPAGKGTRRRAEAALHRLTQPFFRHHHRLARMYGTLAMSPHRRTRLIAWMLRHLVPRHGPPDDARTLTTSAGARHEREDDLQAASEKLAHQLFETHIRLLVFGSKTGETDAAAKLREMAGAFGQFSAPRLASFHASALRRSWRVPSRFRHPPFLLSTEELATLCHPPTTGVRPPTLARIGSKEFEPPVTLPRAMPKSALTVLGVTIFRSGREAFGILPEDRRRHIAILGKTGMGKSTLLEHLLATDIRSGQGVALIDPHGDLCDAVLQAIPRSRTNDVVLFDASDTAFPVGFNPLHCPAASQRPLVASGVVSAFKKLYAESWGPRLEYILRNAVLALVERPDATLLSLLRLLGDPAYRSAVTGQLTDPVVRAFWEREFPCLPPRLQVEAVAPIQNKVGQFVTSPVIRNIVGQSRNTVDLRRILDEGKILLVNLSKGKIGDDASHLLGSLLVTRLQLAAMSRADTPESKRRDFHLYVDEFQNFATQSFATTLSEARKYHLTLTVANQYLDQLDDQTRAALFGNVGTLLSFQVGPTDAEMLVPQFGSELTEQDLVRLPRYHAYARLLIDGQPSTPFSMQTLPPTSVKPNPERVAIVRRYSRQRYARPATAIEPEIALRVEET